MKKDKFHGCVFCKRFYKYTSMGRKYCTCTYENRAMDERGELLRIETYLEMIARHLDGANDNDPRWARDREYRPKLERRRQKLLNG